MAALSLVEFFRNIFTKDFDRRLASTSHLGLGVKFDTSLNFLFHENFVVTIFIPYCVYDFPIRMNWHFLLNWREKTWILNVLFWKTEKCKQWRMDRKLTLSYMKISKYRFCFSNLWFYKFFSKCWLPNILQVKFLLKISLKCCEKWKSFAKICLNFSVKSTCVCFHSQFLQNKANFLQNHRNELTN